MIVHDNDTVSVISSLFLHDIYFIIHKHVIIKILSDFKRHLLQYVICSKKHDIINNWAFEKLVFKIHKPIDEFEKKIRYNS